MIKKIAFALLFTVASSTTPHAEAFDEAQKNQIEDLVRNYLLEHPEILREMSTKLQAQDKLAEEQAREQGLATNQKAVYALEGDAVVGNPKGDVTIVEFLDYNCGWCKKSVDEVTMLQQQDANLRIVFKEFPIFGAGSEYAAKAVLASKKQNKYWELHQELFKQESQITPEVVDSVAIKLGIDLTQLKLDMAETWISDTMAANSELAKSLQIEGTPAFVIDDKVVPGYADAASLMLQIAAIRANGGCKLC